MKKDILKGKKTLKADLDYIDQVAKKVKTEGEVIQEIPLEKIREKMNIRKEYREESIKEMANSIEKTKGKLLEAITVMESEDGFYDIVFGHRRFKGMVYLNKMKPESYFKIQCVVKEKGELDQKEIVLLQIIENAQREDLGAWELADSFKKLRDFGYSIKQIAAEIGKSEGYVKKISMSISKINKESEIKQIVESSTGVTLSDIEITNPLPNKTQIELLKEKAEGKIKSRRDLQDKVWQMREEMYSENKVYRENREKTKFDIINHNVKFKGIKVKSFHIDEEELTFDDANKLKDQLNEIINRVSSIIKTKFSDKDTDSFLQEAN